jgi:hypothetical protein
MLLLLFLLVMQHTLCAQAQYRRAAPARAGHWLRRCLRWSCQCRGVTTHTHTHTHQTQSYSFFFSSTARTWTPTTGQDAKQRERATTTMLRVALTAQRPSLGGKPSTSTSNLRLVPPLSGRAHHRMLPVLRATPDPSQESERQDDDASPKPVKADGEEELVNAVAMQSRLLIAMWLRLDKSAVTLDAREHAQAGGELMRAVATQQGQILRAIESLAGACPLPSQRWMAQHDPSSRRRAVTSTCTASAYWHTIPLVPRRHQCAHVDVEFTAYVPSPRSHRSTHAGRA